VSSWKRILNGQITFSSFLTDYLVHGWVNELKENNQQLKRNCHVTVTAAKWPKGEEMSLKRG
jgi:hypothetical protein